MLLGFISNDTVCLEGKCVENMPFVEATKTADMDEDIYDGVIGMGFEKTVCSFSSFIIRQFLIRTDANFRHKNSSLNS